MKGRTVTLTGPQVRVIHEVLSMVENDPDWAAMLGGQRDMDTLQRAHSAILLAGLSERTQPGGSQRG